MTGMVLDADLVFLDMDASGAEGVIRALGTKLIEKGYVREGFIDAVIERERDFPTGLPTAIPVALPHTDAIHCARCALAIAVLRHPVTFREMGDSTRELSVQIVMLLAIDDPKAQVPWLQSIVGLLQDGDCLRSIQTATDSRELALQIQQMLEEKENHAD